MEGNKKNKRLAHDCFAVSEVLGQILMVAIVALAFSSISLAVFSDGGAMNPPHTPHTDLQENIDTRTDTVQIFHSGGEAIDLEDIKIILNVNGQQAEFNMSDQGVKVLDPEGDEMSSEDVFMLGDHIVINASTKGIELTGGDAVNLYFIHTESSQVIQKAVLQRGVGNIPYWITPYPNGEVWDYSPENSKGRLLPSELVDGINDGLLTDTLIPKNAKMYEEFTFEIDADEMGIKLPLTQVLLKIVYQTHDRSQDNLTLQIYDGDPAPPNEWVQIDTDMKEYKDVVSCDIEGLTVYNITSNVTTIEELENLTVRFKAVGNAANESEKIGWVDFIGVHVEWEK